MVKFKRLSARVFDPKLKARVQNTGKLGFGEDTVRTLNLDRNTYVSFMLDEESKDDTLYMSISRNASTDAFQVNVAGKYCNLSTARMFDSLGIEYKSKTAIYDLVRMSNLDEELEGEVYKMLLRYTNKKQNDEEDNIPESSEDANE